MKQNYRIVSLYSGSGGNSTFIRIGDIALLIDAGKSARALCRALDEIGEDIENISAIFITHEHTDHIAALEVLTKKHPMPIHITEGSADKVCCRCAEHLLSCFVVEQTEFSVKLGDVRISSFRTPHDSRMSVGYRIEFFDGEQEHAIGYATDIGYISEDIRQNLLGCEAVVLESNHDVDMLRDGPYPYDLKQRVASKRGHLSNCECAEFATELANHGTRAIMLAHLSKENNDPCLALDETERAVSGLGVKITVSHPDEPRELIFPKEEDINAEREIYNPWNA